MYRRVITAVAVVVGIYSAASAQDVKLPEIEFGRYHALLIGNLDYKTALGPSIDVLAG